MGHGSILAMSSRLLFVGKTVGICSYKVGKLKMTSLALNFRFSEVRCRSLDSQTPLKLSQLESELEGHSALICSHPFGKGCGQL